MKAEQRDTLAGYVRHAEHYGTDEVFETACDGGLRLSELAQLARRLQNLDGRWKLTVDAQRLFVLALMHSGMSAKDSARTAGVALATAGHWWTEREDPSVEEVDPELALRRASKSRFEDLKGIVRGWRRTA